MNMIIHDDGHTNVISVDGLLDETEVFKKTENKGFKYDRFDFIITNPPFGSSIKESEKSYLKNFYLGKKQVDWLDHKNGKITHRNNQSTEVLFIEQCYNYLTEGGYLAVVLPDGILTNSSLQYVRDAIEDWYRIVAVVSMPQTAFAATGAGVKSSVLFVKKHKKNHTNKLKGLKEKIQNDIKSECRYIDKIEQWEQEKKKKIDSLDGFENEKSNLSNKEIKASEAYKEWKAEINQVYIDKIIELQEEMGFAYQEAKANKLPDYPIFMAIAENIGYDATGKSSAKLVSKNELIDGNYKYIIEQLSHDLYDERVRKKYDLHDDKEELATKKEVLPAGILLELTNFINEVEDGKI
jgi:type I restriction enzyme M protein